MKTVKYVIGTIVIVMLWTASLRVVYNKAATEKHNDEITSTYYIESDTLVKQFWEFPHFQFYLKHIGNGYPNRAFISIHLNSTDKDYFMFDCHTAIDGLGVEPEKLYDDLYAFPYYTGGNYSRSSGIELFRVTADTVIYIGPVCGFEDMNNDGEKEFYVYDVAFFGEGQAMNIYDTILVELIGDSLAYPFFDGSY